LGPWQSFVSYWKNYFNFKGRSSRADYWWVQLWLAPHIIISQLPRFIKIPSASTVQAENANLTFGIFLIFVYSILLLNAVLTYVFLIPSMSLTSRRLHDIGLTAWWYVLGTITLIFFSFIFHSLRQVVPFWALIFIVLSLFPSRGPNKFGEKADV